MLTEWQVCVLDPSRNSFASTKIRRGQKTNRQNERESKISTLLIFSLFLSLSLWENIQSLWGSTSAGQKTLSILLTYTHTHTLTNSLTHSLLVYHFSLSKNEVFETCTHWWTWRRKISLERSVGRTLSFSHLQTSMKLACRLNELVSFVFLFVKLFFVAFNSFSLNPVAN
jgi:hypothetical protein